MSPTMAPAYHHHHHQQQQQQLDELLFTSDPSFAIHGEILMLVLVILFALFLSFLIFSLFTKRATRSIDHEQDDDSCNRIPPTICLVEVLECVD
ncbi:hypothetical protein BVC80_9077g76 [Macleaya cordata]|uniref:Transmembrane protein n=1 Tax=Macleaya cordata TaxID=56857 RepID=A0A200PLR1_MACCD|nr:hypothetical protein BVC80_9077g76 [Macleaya cordata]